MSRALDAARARSPQIVVLEGEAGIGKTALLRRCLAAAQDVVALQASVDESESNLDFGVISQLVSHAGPGPSLRSLNGRLADRLAISPFTAGVELLATLGALQDQGPVAVVVDDAHWIDASSAGALLFALRRLYADRVCVLIATRPAGPGQDRESWSRLLNDAERVRRLSLTGLDSREVMQLGDSVGHPALTLAAAERLREHTHGHPLHLRALLRELPRQALALHEGPLPAPRSFAATILARLTSISADAQDLVSAAAVAGARCTVNLGGRVAGVSDPVSALDEALTANPVTLVRGQVPNEISFAHPLVRAAVYDDLSLTRRRELHLACAKLMSGPAALAHRISASAGADDALADELVRTGQDEVARGMLSAGIDHLLLASRLAASRSAREAALLDAIDYFGISGASPEPKGFAGPSPPVTTAQGGASRLQR